MPCCCSHCQSDHATARRCFRSATSSILRKTRHLRINSTLIPVTVYWLHMFVCHPVDTFVLGNLYTVCKKQVNHGPSDCVCFSCHPVDTFVPGNLYTVCKKQVNHGPKLNHGPSESETYQALMEDPVHEVVPKFYREFEQNDEGLSAGTCTVSCSSTFLQLLLVLS